ncbi:MAG TPA: hypothetical protein VGS13_00455 [Stellaceae bacterium]|nr:hypothetical protein [Stellaceae bacterium]
MTGGQVAALGCAIALLLPGGCFLLVGIASTDPNGLVIGVSVLIFAGLMFWVAFSRRSGPAAPPDAPEP